MLHLAISGLGLTVVNFNNTQDMLEWLRKNLEQAVLTAPDHGPGAASIRDGGLFEPGIGREVADFLAERAPVCPVVIHSSNSPAAEGMQFCLERAGWSVTRVYPVDDLAWVEREWRPALQSLIDRPSGGE